MNETIKKLRKEKNMTQIELAEKAGVAVNTIRLYENGKIKPRYDTLLKISDGLEVSISELLQHNTDNIKHRIDDIYFNDQIRHDQVMLQKHIELYNQLTDAGKMLVDDFIALLLENTHFNNKK